MSLGRFVFDFTVVYFTYISNVKGGALQLYMFTFLYHGLMKTRVEGRKLLSNKFVPKVCVDCD